MAQEHVFAVLTNATEGQEDEFNAWYDKVHLPEVVAAVPGFVAARRYRLSPAQLEGYSDTTHRYLALYWVQGDPAEALAALSGGLGDGTIVLQPCIDTDDIVCMNFEAIAPLLGEIPAPTA